MPLPMRATLDDIENVCKYLAAKPTGATLKEAQSIVDSKHLHPEKIAALKFWKLIDEHEGKLKVTPDGRQCVKGENERVVILTEVIRKINPYNTTIERAAHRKDDALTAAEVGAHWHEHFPSEVGDSDEILNAQAVCFFNVAAGAKLGTLIVGRKGALTRFSFSAEALSGFIQKNPVSINDSTSEKDAPDDEQEDADKKTNSSSAVGVSTFISPQEKQSTELGQAIFIAHGKNKKPVEQLKKVLDQFKIPYKVRNAANAIFTRAHLMRSTAFWARSTRSKTVLRSKW